VAHTSEVFSRYERLLIGRYLLPRGEGRIIVAVAAIGMTAVAIGVAALIVVMSVMNGVRTKVSIQFAGVDGHASISRSGGRLADWRSLEAEARRHSAVTATVPTLEAPVMASIEDQVLPGRVRGLRTEDMGADPILSGGNGSFLGAIPSQDEDVAIGSDLAARLGAAIGSRLVLMHPTLDRDGTLSVKSVGYFVTGVVETGLPQHDASLIIMKMSAAQAMLGSGDAVSRINLTTPSAERASELLRPLIAQLRGRATVQTWRELNKPIFDALALDQVGMFIALSMIVLVALFNILSSLMMLVRSKVRDIAIMRTMGASRTSIVRIFVAVGTVIGSTGAGIGILLGLSIVAFRKELGNFLTAHVLGNSYATEVALLVDLPAELGIVQGAGILAMAMAGTMLATLYPAMKAANVDPASVLRYE
jgi:lipoprotein-releasing system permease protein